MGRNLAPVEALRGVAAWSIVCFHVWLFTSAAKLTWNLGPATVFMKPLQSGVTLFFVLSGFLLYRPFINGRPSIGRYFRNRALRILPAYWTVLIAAFALGATVTLATTHGNLIGRLTDGRLAQSLLLLQGYRPASIFNGIPPAWSLGVEVGFYLLLPVVALLGRRSPWLPPILMLTAGFAGKAVLSVALGANGLRVFDATWNSTLAHSLVAHADLFGFGMAAAVVFTRWHETSTPAWITGGIVGRSLAYVGIPVTVLGYYFIPPYVYESLVAAFCAIVLLRVTSPAYGARFLSSRIATANGRISYSVFLWNYPVLAFLSVHGLLVPGHGAASFFGNAAMTVAAVGILSVLSYRLVEAPAMRWRRSSAVRESYVPAPAPAG